MTGRKFFEGIGFLFAIAEEEVLIEVLVFEGMLLLFEARDFGVCASKAAFKAAEALEVDENEDLEDLKCFLGIIFKDEIGLQEIAMFLGREETKGLF